MLDTLVNIALFMLTFRLLTAREVPTRDLRLGAIAAGIGWQAVQLLGTYFASHALKGSSEAYGVFGLVLGLIAWIYLLSLVTVLDTYGFVIGSILNPADPNAGANFAGTLDEVSLYNVALAPATVTNHFGFFGP